VGYYQTWSANWASTGATMDLARIPAYVNGAPPASALRPAWAGSVLCPPQHPRSSNMLSLAYAAASAPVVIVSFLDPACTYTKGSFSLGERCTI
jgi:hypothetical protein